MDLLKPDYNILLVAGSNLGFKHSQETLLNILLQYEYIHRTVQETLLNKPHSNPIPLTPNLRGPKVTLLITIPIRIGLSQLTNTQTGGIGPRRPKCNIRTRHLAATPLLLCIKQEILDKAYLRGLDSTGASRERVFTDMRPVAQNRINQRSGPGCSMRVLHNQAIWMQIRRRNIDSTAHTRSAVSTIAAILGVGSCGPWDEAGERSVNDAGAVRGVGPGL